MSWIIPPNLCISFWALNFILDMQVVNFLLRGWIRNVESQGSVELPLLDCPESFQYDFSKDLEFTRDGSRKSVRVNFYGSRSSFWNRMRSFFKPLVKDQGIDSTKAPTLFKWYSRLNSVLYFVSRLYNQYVFVEVRCWRKKRKREKCW